MTVAIFLLSFTTIILIVWNIKQSEEIKTVVAAQKAFMYISKIESAKNVMSKQTKHTDLKREIENCISEFEKGGGAIVASIEIGRISVSDYEQSAPNIDLVIKYNSQYVR